MTKTFNRAPFSVPTPSSSDVKNYFFNHYNWKGLNDDKNILSVDQETFQDCNNMYMDSEGLLRSRPALKVKVVKYGSTNAVLSNVTNVWTFGNVTVYESFLSNLYYLTFVNSDFPDNAIQQSFSHNNYKLVLTDKKIFVFAIDGFYYYGINKDTNLPTWYSGVDALSTIHVPVTSVIVNGIPNEVDVEKKNLLTNSYITKYIFNSLAENDNFSIFVGDTVSIKIDGIVYGPITFVENNNLVFVNKYFSLAKNNFSDNYIYGKGGEGIPLVDFSDNGSIILSSYFKNRNNGWNTDYDWKIYYSTNNVIFEQLPYIDGVIAPAKITKDGNNAVVFLSDGPYIYSLTKYKYVDDTAVKEFNNWTNLLRYIDNDKYNSLVIYLDRYSQVNGEFINSTDFTFSYTSDNQDNFVNITSVNSVFSKRIIFGVALDESTPISNPATTELKTTKTTGDGGRTINVSVPTIEKTFSYDTGNVTIECHIAFEVYTASDRVRAFCYGNIKNSSIPGVEDYPFDYSDYSDYPSWHSPWDIVGQIFDISISDTSTEGKLNNITVVITPKKINQIPPTLVDGHRVRTNNDIPVCKMIVDKSSGSLSYKAITLFTCYYYSGSPSQRIFVKCLYSFTDTAMKKEWIEYDTINSYCLLKYDDVVISTNGIMYCSGKKGVTVYTLANDYTSITTSLLVNNNNVYCKISNVYHYIATDLGIFAYTDYPNNFTYTYIPWLFNVKPIYYNASPYMYDDTSVYSYFNKNIEISKTTVESQNYIVPSHVSELSNFYFSNGSELYISQNYVTPEGKFEWYFPDITLQKFNYNITNLHPISNEIMSIFFNDEIWYVTFDSEVQAYRYYKSKLQVGCKEGSDVLTTFDGKYTVFAGERGLVAMSYQDFIASDEQSLTYLSDIIYDRFKTYLNGPIKLYKYGFWLLVYKQNSKDGYIYDLRNNSWWPVTGIDNNTKFVTINNEVQLLCNGKMYVLNKLDINYFDYDGLKKTKINWFVKSQKLHLSALNNYKHIINMTFVSVHDTKALEAANYNVECLDFKLQVNNYRKQIDGNINSSDKYVNVNYTVGAVRTFVQRLNYSKVNEFQYMLSSDENNAIEIPFSVNSITIKYKVGGQVR